MPYFYCKKKKTSTAKGKRLLLQKEKYYSNFFFRIKEYRDCIQKNYCKKCKHFFIRFFLHFISTDILFCLILLWNQNHLVVVPKSHSFAELNHKIISIKRLDVFALSKCKIKQSITLFSYTTCFALTRKKVCGEIVISVFVFYSP